MTRTRVLFLSLGLLLLGAGLRWPSLGLPLDRDEGEFASLAWLWSSGHGVPYLDYLEQKPPATLGLHAVAQAAFADGVEGLRYLSQFWTALTVLLLGLLLLHWGRERDDSHRWERGAWVAGLLAALLFSSSRTQSLAANTEGWLALPLALAFTLAFGGPYRGRRAVAVGAALGLASLFKQPVLVGLLFIPWAARPGEGRLLRAVAWSSLGAGLVWALAWACFALNGAGAALLNCTWAYNQAYVAGGWAGALGRAVGLARWLAPELGGAVLLAAYGWWRLGPGRLRRALGAWMGIALVLLTVAGRFYPHYTVGLLAPLALLGGAAFALPATRGQAFLRGSLLGLALLGWLYANGALWVERDPARRSYQIFGVEHFAAAPAAAVKIDAVCPADKPLFIWGDEAELYYLARRAPASRFLYTYPFTGEAPPWPDGAAELRAALGRSDLGAAVMSKALDALDPLQMEVQSLLQQRFDADPSVRPYLIGKPRP
jgi:hypothetical protein